MVNAIRLVPLFLYLVLCACSPGEVTKKEVAGQYPISLVDIRSVNLTDNFWLPRIKMIQDVTIPHSFEKCEHEGRMDNFLIAGNQKSGTTRGAMPFDDTDLYKIIEGASYTLVSLPDPALDAYIDSVISIIAIGQEPDGYLTTWFTIDRENPPATWVKPSKERWENEITSHELYNSGHLFEAAAAHHWATGKTNLLDIASKNADLLVEKFGPGKLQVPPGHQIIETGLIRLYHITGKKEYLTLARDFLEWRGDSTTHKLYGPYNQDHKPVTEQSEAVGHAVRAEYQYAAMTDIAAIYNDDHYLQALHRIWDDIVKEKMYVTGGVGARHDGEAFGDDYELPNLTAYSETCAAIGSVAWNQKMFLLTGDSKYFDVAERTLYNGLIAGLSADGTQFFYPNPLESDGKYTFNRGACTRQSWFDCSCCPTNLIRFIPSLPALIYATQGDTLYTNLYVSNEATIRLGDREVRLSQQTEYPWDGKVTMKIDTGSDTPFAIKLRVPGWARNEAVPGGLYSYVDNFDSAPTVSVNGESVATRMSNGYFVLTRRWNSGDVVEVNFPMEVRMVKTNGPVEENKGKVAFERGPFVYCAEEADNRYIDNIVINGKSSVEADPVQLGVAGEDVVVLDGDVTLIPYFLWSNRGVGKMKVWLKHEN